jgi:hypothetical protein
MLHEVGEQFGWHLREHLQMADLRGMTGKTERHEIFWIVGAAVRLWDDVMRLRFAAATSDGDTTFAASKLVPSPRSSATQVVGLAGSLCR